MPEDNGQRKADCETLDHLRARRFVNERVLALATRPQYKSSCSVSALTTAINVVASARIGIVSQEHVAKVLGLTITRLEWVRPDGSKSWPGNNTLMRWYTECMDYHGLSGHAAFLLGPDRPAVSEGASAFRTLETGLRSENSAIVYHLENHYAIACGLFECASEPQESTTVSSNTVQWLLIADHAPGRSPIWCRRWDEVCERISTSDRQCLMRFGLAGPVQ